MRIMGIETSADDTGIALIEADGKFGSDFSFKILANETVSQARSHALYGGIYPNVAKHEHAKNIVPALERALREARILQAGAVSSLAHVRDLLAREPEIFEHLSKFVRTYERPEIDCIAVTVGPGLEPCLWTGINLARVLADVWSASRRMPLVGVNHMEGHIVMSMIEIRSRSSGRLAEFEFPAMVLLISGGHTELILMRAFGQYEYLGRTRDDAVGEAFDKVARLLDLPYPGGPEISRLAEKARNYGCRTSIHLPRPMLHDKSYDFSFSGLKTAVGRLVISQSPTLGNSLRSDFEEFKRQVAREFEDAVSDVLVAKTLRAVDEFGANTVVVGGGVSANKHIRSELGYKLQATGCTLLVCPPEFSTDNAVMIALAGYFHALKKEFVAPETLHAQGNLKLA